MVVEHDLKNVTRNSIALKAITLQNIAHGVGSYNIKWLTCSRPEAKAFWSTLNPRR